MPVAVETFDSCAALKPDEWDKVAPFCDPLTSYALTCVCQASAIEGVQEFRHVTFRIGGRLVARATMFVMRVGLDVLAPISVRHVTSLVKRMTGDTLQPVIAFCGLPVSLGGGPLCVDDEVSLALFSSILERLFEQLEIFGRENGAGIICLKELDDEVLHRMELAGVSDFIRVPSLPSWSLHLTWPCPQAFVGAMRAPYRRQLLKARERGAEAGVEIRRCNDVLGLTGSFHALYLQVMKRAESRLETLPKAFFERLSQTFASRLHLIQARIGGDDVAFALNLETEDALYFLLTGIDYPRALPAGVYHLLMDAVICEGIALGKRFVHLGQTSPALKSRFGAQASARHLLLKHRSRFGQNLLRASARLLFPEQHYEVRRVFKTTRDAKD
jgi:hypothetical protein